MGVLTLIFNQSFFIILLSVHMYYLEGNTFWRTDALDIFHPWGGILLHHQHFIGFLAESSMGRGEPREFFVGEDGWWLSKDQKKPWSGWWQLKYFVYFHPELWGRFNPFWRAYFSDGLVQPPTSGDFFQKDCQIRGIKAYEKNLARDGCTPPLLDVEKTCQLFKHQRWSLEIHRAKRELDGFCLFFGSGNESATVRNLNEGEPRFNNYMASLYFHNEALVFSFSDDPFNVT